MAGNSDGNDQNGQLEEIHSGDTLHENPGDTEKTLGDADTLESRDLESHNQLTQALHTMDLLNSQLGVAGANLVSQYHMQKQREAMMAQQQMQASYPQQPMPMPPGQPNMGGQPMMAPQGFAPQMMGQTAPQSPMLNQTPQQQQGQYQQQQMQPNPAQGIQANQVVSQQNPQQNQNSNSS